MGGEKQMVDVLDSTTEMEGGQTRTLGIETAMCSDHLGLRRVRKYLMGQRLQLRTKNKVGPGIDLKYGGVPGKPH